MPFGFQPVADHDFAFVQQRALSKRHLLLNLLL